MWARHWKQGSQEEGRQWSVFGGSLRAESEAIRGGPFETPDPSKPLAAHHSRLCFLKGWKLTADGS